MPSQRRTWKLPWVIWPWVRVQKPCAHSTSLGPNSPHRPSGTVEPQAEDPYALVPFVIVPPKKYLNGTKWQEGSIQATVGKLHSLKSRTVHRTAIEVLLSGQCQWLIPLLMLSVDFQGECISCVKCIFVIITRC